MTQPAVSHETSKPKQSKIHFAPCLDHQEHMIFNLFSIFYIFLTIYEIEKIIAVYMNLKA